MPPSADVENGPNDLGLYDVVELLTRSRFRCKLKNSKLFEKRVVGKRKARTSRPTYHHGELVTALVKAGRELLEEGGAGQISLRETARRVGVSQTAPLHYLNSKAGLLAAIAAEGFRELTALRRMTAMQIADPTALLKEHIRNYVLFARGNKGLFQLMFGPALDRAAFPELRQAAQDSYAGFAKDVSRYAGNAGWRPDETPLAVATAWGVQHGLASLIINKQIPVPMDPLDLTELVNRAAAVLVAGLDATRSPANKSSKCSNTSPRNGRRKVKLSSPA